MRPGLRFFSSKIVVPGSLNWIFGSMRDASGVWKRSYGRPTKAPPDERGGNRHGRPNTTAPHPDSIKRLLYKIVGKKINIFYKIVRKKTNIRDWLSWGGFLDDRPKIFIEIGAN